MIEVVNYCNCPLCGKDFSDFGYYGLAYHLIAREYCTMTSIMVDGIGSCEIRVTAQNGLTESEPWLLPPSGHHVSWRVPQSGFLVPDDPNIIADAMGTWPDPVDPYNITDVVRDASYGNLR